MKNIISLLLAFSVAACASKKEVSIEVTAKSMFDNSTIWYASSPRVHNLAPKSDIIDITPSTQHTLWFPNPHVISDSFTPIESMPTSAPSAPTTVPAARDTVVGNNTTSTPKLTKVSDKPSVEADSTAAATKVAAPNESSKDVKSASGFTKTVKLYCDDCGATVECGQIDICDDKGALCVADATVTCETTVDGVKCVRKKSS